MAGTEVRLHLQRQDVAAADSPHPRCAPLLQLLLLWHEYWQTLQWQLQLLAMLAALPLCCHHALHHPLLLLQLFAARY
jgi:hypothetical protein